MQGKTTLFKLGLVFILPVVLAKGALELNWFNEASTNQGQLLEPTINMSHIPWKGIPKWRLMYVLPAVCDEICENALFSLTQVWIALGRQQNRVESTVIFTASSDQQALAKLRQKQDVALLNIHETAAPINSGDDNAVYIVDTLGNGMLRYTLVEDKQEAILDSKAMLADLRKLLKLSRIG
jgi:hypothetical protein